MASVSDEISPTQNGEIDSLAPLENKVHLENGQLAKASMSLSTEDDKEKNDQAAEEPNQSSTSTSVASAKESPSINSMPTSFDVQEEKLTSVPSQEINEENIDNKTEEKETTTSKTRSVNFAGTRVDDKEESESCSANNLYTNSPSRTSRRPNDFIDTLVESYKIETSNGTSSTREEKKYEPKTNRSRLNPNWREHRTRRLMNKLEELSLWDREEELKAAQAQSLREQKWEQIQDRQRNHDLCLNLMRQRHESEMISAVTLDRAAAIVNDESTSATIANTMSLASTANALANGIPLSPQVNKRRIRQEGEQPSEPKTPIGRYRQFERSMANKLEKINQKLQPDREIMRAYNPYYTAMSSTTTPLFSETYSTLLSVPDAYSLNKYNQYHYGVASYLHQPQHASSPDYETRLRSYSNRDVRVPLKEQADECNYYDDDNTDEHRRSCPTDNDLYTKYRPNPTISNYYTKYHSNLIDDDYHRKYRSNLINEGHYLKYRLNPFDEGSHLNYRLNPIDEGYSYPKYRSSSIDKNDGDDDDDDDDDDDNNYFKCRSNPFDDNYYTKYRSTLSSQLDYSPPRRTTSLASPTASSLYDYSTVTNAPPENSLIHSRQPLSSSIHLRSLNDDFNAMTCSSTETGKKILQNIDEFVNELSLKGPSTITSKSPNSYEKHVEYENFNLPRDHSSKIKHQPIEILSLSSMQ